MRIPEIKSGSYRNEVLTLYDVDGNKMDFERPLWINIGYPCRGFVQLSFMVEWENSGPSGPWGRDISVDFEGIDLGSSIHKIGWHSFI